MFKVNNKNTRTSGVFIVNFEHISHFFSIVSIVDFKQVNVSLKSKEYPQTVAFGSIFIEEQNLNLDTA